MKSILVTALIATAVLTACGPAAQNQDPGSPEDPIASRSDALNLRSCGTQDLFQCIDLTLPEACLLISALKSGSDISSLIPKPVVAAAVKALFIIHEGWFSNNIGTRGLELDFNPFVGMITEAKPIGGSCPNYCSTSKCPSGGGGGGGGGNGGGAVRVR